MKMFDLKPYGAFVENTLRPFLEESESLLRALSILNLTKEDISKALNKVAFLHLMTILLNTITTISCTAILGFVAWKTFR